MSFAWRTASFFLVALAAFAQTKSAQQSKSRDLKYEEDRPAWVLAEATAKSLKLSYKPLGAEVSVVRELRL